MAHTQPCNSSYLYWQWQPVSTFFFSFGRIESRAHVHRSHNAQQFTEYLLRFRSLCSVCRASRKINEMKLNLFGCRIELFSGFYSILNHVTKIRLFSFVKRCHCALYPKLNSDLLWLALLNSIFSTDTDWENSKHANSIVLAFFFPLRRLPSTELSFRNRETIKTNIGSWFLFFIFWLVVFYNKTLADKRSMRENHCPFRAFE